MSIPVTEKMMLAVQDSAPITFSPTSITSLDPVYGHNFPIWSIYYVPTIMRDPRVNYGMKLIKGPIKTFSIFLPEKDAEDPLVQQTLREEGIQFVYTVKSDNSALSEYVLDTLNAFWANGLEEYLTMLEWGYSCCQPIYELENPNDPKSLEYKHLIWYHPLHSRPLIVKDTTRLVGAQIEQVHNNNKEIKLFGPKLLWGVHRKIVNSLYGQSLLFDCFTSFHEQWAPYGARDIRRTWFHKNSYDGGEVRFPIGTYKDASGNIIDHRDMALKILADMKTGGGRAIPSTVDPASGKPAWDYIPPQANATPQGLMEYPEALRIEILEGLGIPPEVVESSSSNGMGSATGRKIPMSVYYSTLSGIADNAVHAFNNQCIKYLTKLRFGLNSKYKIVRVNPIKTQDQMQPTNSLEKLETNPELS
jgi:hypothetical protein